MTALVERQNITLAQPAGFSPEQIDLIKNTVAVGTSDLELALFLEVCKSTGLNPFQKQVYAVVRKSKAKVNGHWVETSKMVIQTGIDGYRLTASRSGVHMGTTDPQFGPAENGYPEWAQVVVRKLVHGHVVEFPATARWAEYVQQKAEYSGGSPTGKQIVSDMWARMPHTMLGKCAESLALRKAFPAELSGVYSDVEMQQADSEAPVQQARSVDVTRGVAQAAGVEVQQVNPNADALAAWKVKLGKVGRRLGELGARDEATAIMARWPKWNTDVDYAIAAYNELMTLGESLPSKKSSESEVVEAEVVTVTLITDKQRKALMGQLGRLKLPDTTEVRSAFYSWMVGTADGTRTNDLDGETAQGLIDTLEAMDPSEVEATAAEFKQAARL